MKFQIRYNFLGTLMLIILLAGLSLLLPVTEVSALNNTWTVNSTGDAGNGSGSSGDLRYALAQAQLSGGGTIVFDPAVFNGNSPIVLQSSLPAIDIGSGTLGLEGPGAELLTISGNNLYRIFELNSGNVTITGLTIADGKVIGSDGSNGSNGNNSVKNGSSGNNGGSGVGGAVYNAGTLTVLNCVFSNNMAVGGIGGKGGNGYNGSDIDYGGGGGSGGAGGNGFGGAIYNTGSLTINYSTFSGNNATGGLGGTGGNSGTDTIGLTSAGPGGSGGNGFGGAVYNTGTTNIKNSVFSGDSTTGGKGNTGGMGFIGAPSGKGGQGGIGYGGAVYNTGTMISSNNKFSGDSAAGGVGGNGGEGNMASSGCNGGAGNSGGDGSGGAAYNTGTLTVSGSTFSNNSAAGGTGGLGGISPCFGSLSGVGGKGGSGGNGSGGAVSNTGTLSITGGTFSGDGVTGGTGGKGGYGQRQSGVGVGGNGGNGGNSWGGALSNERSLAIVGSWLSGDSVAGGAGGAAGQGYDGSFSPVTQGTPGSSGSGATKSIHNGSGGQTSALDVHLDSGSSTTSGAINIVSVSSYGVPADGTSQITVTSAVYNAAGVLEQGVGVTITTTLGSLGTLGPILTDVNGLAAGTITSTVAGTATVQLEAEGYPLVSTEVSFDASSACPAEIMAAGVTGFVAPGIGNAPQEYTALATGSAEYCVSGLSWTPNDNPFKASTAYMATVTLTSAPGYEFPAGGIAVPTANGVGTVSAGTTSGSGSGNTLTFTVQFPVTPIDITMYTISITSLTGGNITASPTSATSGTAINLTITPDAGMQLKVGTLKYSDGITDHLISGTGFSMPAANVTVSAEFNSIPVPPVWTWYPGQLQFSESSYSVDENAGTATITVNRLYGSDGTVTVHYSTSDNTASAGEDYTATSGDLTFGYGETSKTFIVPITKNDLLANNKTVNLTLTNPTGGAYLGSQATATLIIYPVQEDTSLEITTSSMPSGTVGVAYNADLNASGGKTPYTWSTAGLPAGLTLSSSTGVISGTPTEEGLFPVKITVTDSGGRNALGQYTIAIVADKSALITAITNATNLLGNTLIGTAAGDVSQETHDSYSAAITSATVVRDNANATQAEVDTAVNALETATNVFNNAIIQSTSIIGFTVSRQVGSSTINSVSHTVTFHMPLGTNVKKLVPTIALSSGVTSSPKSRKAQNFTNPVKYTVTAQEGTSQDWTVTCIVDPGSSAKYITGFRVSKQVGNSIIDSTNHTISFHMPYGTNLKRVPPTITVSEFTKISPKSRAAKNFTNPVKYTVTAQDGTSQDWTVTCIVDPKSGAKDITGFRVSKQVGKTTIDTTNHTISFHMPYGTNVKRISPTITVSALAKISPKSRTEQNFTEPVTYTVTAQDGTSQDWTVTCIIGTRI